MTPNQIPIITLIHSVVVIHSSGNPDRGFAAPVAEDLSTRDSQGKGIMANAAIAPPVGASRPRPSFGHASLFRDIFRDAIHRDFFPFSPGPYYATYPEGGIAKNYEFSCEEWDAPHHPTLTILTKEVFKDPSVCKTVVDKFPTSGEMVWIEALSSDQLTAKSHHEYGQSTGFKLEGYQEKFTCLTGLESQVSGLHRQVVGLNDKLSSSNAAFSKSKAKGNKRKKKIKSRTKSLDNIHAKVARQFQGLEKKFLTFDEFSRVQAELLSLAASAGFERGLSMHRTKEEFAPHEELAHLVNVHVLRDSPISPPLVKGSTVTPTSKSLELPSNVIPASSTAALEPNEEWVNAMVDGPDHVLTDGAVNVNLGSAFMQGAFYVVDDAVDATELSLIGLEHVSSGPSDVVVALYDGEKGDGSMLSSPADEEAATTPSRV
ncbi:hypothetical protein Tco_1470874 [Tanacetum coccineum]